MASRCQLYLLLVLQRQCDLIPLSALSFENDSPPSLLVLLTWALATQARRGVAGSVPAEPMVGPAQSGLRLSCVASARLICYCFLSREGLFL